MNQRTLTQLTDLGGELLHTSLAQFPRMALANSLSAEDMVLTDLVVRHNLDVEIFVLDTGRLHEETYEVLDRAQKHYAKSFRILSPKSSATEQFVAQHGINGFYDGVEQRKSCCFIRKVEPLRRALAGKDAWITGLRKQQSVTRSDLGHVEWDEANGLYKINPLLDWKQDEVWSYVKLHQVPYNKLHDQGFPSIGCAPCTRPITPGEDPRAGRWWWESPESKECGLHERKVA